MPNLTVPAAALGLPIPPPDLRAVMRRAHQLAAGMPARIPYADRLALALRRTWSTVRDEVAKAFRMAAAARVERLLAFLDALDGDTDLEDTHDAEADRVDDEPSLGSADRALNQEHWGHFADWPSPGGDLELDDCDFEDGGDIERNGDEQDGDRWSIVEAFDIPSSCANALRPPATVVGPDGRLWAAEVVS